MAAVLTAGDIPGENQVGSMVADQPLLAADRVRYVGQPLAMVVIEAAIVAAAETLNVPAWTLQQKNLLHRGDAFPFGMRIQGDTSPRSFDAAVSRFHVRSRLADIERRNAASNFVKRGLAVMPVCFGIAFTTSMLNQAGALVHVFVDGSVSVSTAAVEIGQGVATKLRRVAATALGIARTCVRIETTSTARVANMSPTAASSAADLNGAAVRLACGTLLQRLKTVAAGIQGVPAGQVAIRDGRILIFPLPPLKWFFSTIPPIPVPSWRARRLASHR